jgi:hypothetical protein
LSKPVCDVRLNLKRQLILAEMRKAVRAWISVLSSGANTAFELRPGASERGGQFGLGEPGDYPSKIRGSFSAEMPGPVLAILSVAESLQPMSAKSTQPWGVVVFDRADRV